MRCFWFSLYTGQKAALALSPSVVSKTIHQCLSRQFNFFVFCQVAGTRTYEQSSQNVANICQLFKSPYRSLVVLLNSNFNEGRFNPISVCMSTRHTSLPSFPCANLLLLQFSHRHKSIFVPFGAHTLSEIFTRNFKHTESALVNYTFPISPVSFCALAYISTTIHQPLSGIHFAFSNIRYEILSVALQLSRYQYFIMIYRNNIILLIFSPNSHTRSLRITNALHNCQVLWY